MLPKNLELSFNISATAEASDVKFGTQLGIATAHNKIAHRAKSGRGLGLGKLPNIWSSPLIFLQRLRCLLSVSGASCILFIST